MQKLHILWYQHHACTCMYTVHLHATRVSILQAAKHHLLTENLREIWYSQTSDSTLSLKSMQNWCVLHFSNGGKFIPKWTSVLPVLLAAYMSVHAKRSERTIITLSNNNSALRYLPHASYVHNTSLGKHNLQWWEWCRFYVPIPCPVTAPLITAVFHHRSFYCAQWRHAAYTL